MFDDAVLMITGGTGSFGRKFTKIILQRFRPKKVIIFSRDEFKQEEMRRELIEYENQLRFFIGDVRDKERLRRALEGVEYVIHAAAFKQVPAAEYNPFEAVRTNIIGSQNLVEAALDTGVKKVIALSTDKAVNPVNLYGATKLAMEKIVISGENYAGNRDIAFCVVRYGNVLGSRGSVIPLFLDLKRRGMKEFPLTDERMTRFWITLEEAVETVLLAFEKGLGGEIFVPKLPSMRLVDLARAIEPECRFRIIGIRPGEKLHETLIAEDEARTVKDLGKHYVILPQFIFRRKDYQKAYGGFDSVPEGFYYRSDRNNHWLTVEDLRRQIETSLGIEL